MHFKLRFAHALHLLADYWGFCLGNGTYDHKLSHKKALSRMVMCRLRESGHLTLHITATADFCQCSGYAGVSQWVSERFIIPLIANMFLKDISSAEERPSWALGCIIHLSMGVWDLNKVYCLKTGLAAWPSCSSKNCLRNSQLWNWQLPLNSCPGFWVEVQSTIIWAL